MVLLSHLPAALAFRCDQGFRLLELRFSCQPSGLLHLEWWGHLGVSHHHSPECFMVCLSRGCSRMSDLLLCLWYSLGMLSTRFYQVTSKCILTLRIQSNPCNDITSPSWSISFSMGILEPFFKLPQFTNTDLQSTRLKV